MQVRLKRALGLWLLIGYGLGVTIGAGIYVLVGSVARVAGDAAPLSFAIAGLTAALIGLCYAELAVRLPEAAGTPAYVQVAFGVGWLSRLAGIAVCAVLALSAASIARGSAGYIRELIALPVPIIAGGVVALGTSVACLGVRESVGAAAAMTVIEVGGLLVVVATGMPHALGAIDRVSSLALPDPAVGWPGVASGAFLAFFAFVGFENLANMAEESREPEQTMPRAILLSLALSTALYVVVSAVAVLVVPEAQLVSTDVPLLLVIRHAPWFSPALFIAVALIAIGNGVLLEIMALGRLIYGMACRGWLPGALAVVGPGSRVPLSATLVGGGLVLALTLLLPFVSLAALTSGMTLAIFALVAAALHRLHRSAPRVHGFRLPRLVPPLAIAACAVLAICAVLY